MVRRFMGSMLGVLRVASVTGASFRNLCYNDLAQMDDMMQENPQLKAVMSHWV
jgi:hypothetical protein